MPIDCYRDSFSCSVLSEGTSHPPGGPEGQTWGLPRLPLDEQADNIRDEAEKALRHSAQGDPSWQIFMVGECPCGHWEDAGMTTFVNKAQLIRGKVSLQPQSGYTDFAWLSREEAIERVTDENLRKLFDQLLPRYT